MDGIMCDFNRICRTCKCVSLDMRSIFETMQNIGDKTRIHEMLMACTSVQVSADDGLPNLICSSCLDQLRSSYHFKKQCEFVDSSLRESAKNAKVNEIKEELQNNDLDIVETILDDGTPKENDTSIQNVPTVPRLFNESKDFLELLEHNQMLLTCGECLKVFTTLDGLRGHKRLHTGALFRCKFCDKEYTRQSHLHRHELGHNRKKVHVCRICNKTLTRLEHLKRHLTTHLKEKPFSCFKCKRGFNREEHLHIHVGKCKGDRTHICEICNKGFIRADSLEVHRKLHDTSNYVLPTLDNLDNIELHYYEIDFDGDTAFSDNSDDIEDLCVEPQVEVTENNQEDNPLEGVPADDEPTVSPKAEDKEEEKSNGDDVETKEGILDVVDETKTLEEEEHCNEADVDNFDADDAKDDSDSVQSEYLPQKPVKIKRGRGRPRKVPQISKLPKRPRGRPPTKHLKKRQVQEEEEEEAIGEFKCPSCARIFTKMSLMEKHAIREHNGLKVHKCIKCKKEFSRGNHLKRHMLTHSEDKPHVCEICTKPFNRKDHLTQHMKLHEKQVELVCDICLKPFNRADHLAKHKASRHSIGEKLPPGEKKYNCEICGKGFTTEKYRDVHVKGHLGVKRFQCKTCDKFFLSKSHLTEHMKFHNENSKKFLCSECGQRFIRNDYLVIHMRRHRGEKPFKCRFCGKGFPRTTDLTVHERYHTGEKTHLCTICGRGFGRAYNLTVHMRTHTGEKPYRCTYCDAAFAQGNDLKAHVRRHTGERFQCELCSENFLMGYLLTQHKRTVHGLNVVSNIRRLQPLNKMNPDNPDEPPPITIPLPKPVIPDCIFQVQIAAAQLHHMAQNPLQNPLE